MEQLNLLMVYDTVPFRIVRPSRVTGPVDMDEIGHLSRVTDKVADGSGRQINHWLRMLVRSEGNPLEVKPEQCHRILLASPLFFFFCLQINRY